MQIQNILDLMKCFIPITVNDKGSLCVKVWRGTIFLFHDI